MISKLYTFFESPCNFNDYYYIITELQKFFGSMFFQWDLEMYDVQLKEPAIANTSDLNEELGQVCHRVYIYLICIMHIMSGAMHFMYYINRSIGTKVD